MDKREDIIDLTKESPDSVRIEVSYAKIQTQIDKSLGSLKKAEQGVKIIINRSSELPDEIQSSNNTLDMDSNQSAIITSKPKTFENITYDMDPLTKALREKNPQGFVELDEVEFLEDAIEPYQHQFRLLPKKPVDSVKVNQTIWGNNRSYQFNPLFIKDQSTLDYKKPKVDPKLPENVDDILNGPNRSAPVPVTSQKPPLPFFPYEKRQDDRKLPMKFYKNKNEKKEQLALIELIKWKANQVDENPPSKRSRLDEPDSIQKPEKKGKNLNTDPETFENPEKKPKTPKPDAKDTKKTSEGFVLNNFINNLKKIDEKIDHAKILEQKSKEDKEYRQRMKNLNFTAPVISEEEKKKREKLCRSTNRNNISDFFNFLFDLDIYDMKLKQADTIPTAFNDGADYIHYFQNGFFEEAKAEILSALNQNDMSEYSLVSLTTHSTKNGFGYLEVRDEKIVEENNGKNSVKEGKFKFSYRAQPEDIILILPFYEDFIAHPNFSNWAKNVEHFIGIIERQKSGYPFLIKIKESALGSFDTPRLYRLFIIDTSTTMLREYKMIRLAEFTELSNQILNPKQPVYTSKNQKIEQFIKSIDKIHNESQLDAIEKISCASSGILLLQGPPGTGKTHTIKGIISAILLKENNNTYILVCAPSNSAIDEIANRIAVEKLYGPGGVVKNDVKLVRVGTQKKYSEDFREKIKKDLRETPQAVQDISLSSLVTKLISQNATESGNNKIDSLMNELDALNKQIYDAKKFKKLSEITLLEEKASNLKGSLFRAKQINKTQNTVRKECETGILNTSNIVFCTLSGAGSKEILEINHSFDYVIVDEACQSVELSSLIPFQFGAKVVILVGDPKQLPATTFSQYSNHNLYSRSLFERLMDGGCKVEMLTIQYRMVSEICTFPSSEFYYNRLETFDRSTPAPDWIANIGVLFINLLTSQESRSSSETSISNTSESEFIGQLFTFLKPLHGKKLNIGVITPYKKQAIIIKEYLNRFYTNDWKIDLEVNTIDGFQGREKDVIIFSAVRSGDTLGFLADSRRINVAITRAKYALWVVANAKCLQNNSVWGRFVQYCKALNKVVDCNRFSEVSKMFEPTSKPINNKSDVSYSNTAYCKRYDIDNKHTPKTFLHTSEAQPQHTTSGKIDTNPPKLHNNPHKSNKSYNPPTPPRPKPAKNTIDLALSIINRK